MSFRNTLAGHQPSASKQRLLIKSGQADVFVGDYPAVILHPSLGCPLIVEDNNRVSLFLVTGKAFKTAFLSGIGQDSQPGALGGRNIRLIINQHLKIQPWEKIASTRKDLSRTDQLLFPEDFDHNIQCTYLGPLAVELRDATSRHVANVRAQTREHFSRQGLGEVFQIDLHAYGFCAGTLYDCFWAVRNAEEDSTDLPGDFVDLRDRMLRRFVGDTWPQGLQDVSKAAFNDLCAYQIDENSGLRFAVDPDTPLQSRHPIYVPAAGKSRLNLGHLSDVHLSSRQHTYKGKRAAVIPEVSEPIGDLANNNADNFLDLLTQLGSDPEVDVLVITGDLYDHLHNFDPSSRDTSTTGKLWEAMYLDSLQALKKRTEEYPYGIDALAVYSVLVHFYTRFQKPIFLISGNHEAYEYPYGISPRVPVIGRVNEGIPLDHNLTFYEAILLYGPGYGTVLKNFNFDPRHFDWFATAFTPLADFVITYKEQCLIGLEWGASESFVRSKARGGGTLPRADGTLLPWQRSLVAQALAHGKQAVLCTHFTLVNYCLSKPLSEQGRFEVSSLTLSPYDQGSCQRERGILYEQFLLHPALQLTLSGHSHRAGLYRCDLVGRTRTSYFSGRSVEAGVEIQTLGHHPQDPAVKNIDWNRRARVFVTASAGPIPKQNLQGEMSGQGMEIPSAGKIVFDGPRPRITLVKSGQPTAKPRFAVACDYIDVMAGGFWEYFRAVGSSGEFEMKIHWEKIHPNFPREKRDEFLKSVTLWMVGDVTESFKAEELRVSGLGESIRVNFARRLMRWLRPGQQRRSSATFLSLDFNSSAVQGLSGFSEYDFDSPWNIQVGIYDGKANDIVNSHNALQNPSAWRIVRHKKYGEIPSFKQRNDMFSEYMTSLELTR